MPSVFSTEPVNWLGRTSPIWPVLCWVGLKILTQSTCVAFLVCPGRDAKCCAEYVCLFFWLSVYSPNSKTSRPNFIKFFVLIAYHPAWSSSGRIVIRYVLPVLWMTSCFYTMGPVGQNQTHCYVKKEFAGWWHRLDVRQVQCLVEFIRMQLPEWQNLLYTTDLFWQCIDGLW